MVTQALVLSTEMKVANASASFSLLPSVKQLSFTLNLLPFTECVTNFNFNTQTIHVVTFSIWHTVCREYYLITGGVFRHTPIKKHSASSTPLPTHALFLFHFTVVGAYPPQEELDWEQLAVCLKNVNAMAPCPSFSLTKRLKKICASPHNVLRVCAAGWLRRLPAPARPLQSCSSSTLAYPRFPVHFFKTWKGIPSDIVDSSVHLHRPVVFVTEKFLHILVQAFSVSDCSRDHQRIFPFLQLSSQISSDFQVLPAHHRLNPAIATSADGSSFAARINATGRSMLSLRDGEHGWMLQSASLMYVSYSTSQRADF